MPDRARLSRGYRFPAERGVLVSQETGMSVEPLHLEIGDAEGGLTAHARMRP